VTLGWAKFRAYSQNADSRRQSNFTVGSRVTLTRGGGGSGAVDLDKWHLVTREFEEPILPGPSSSRIDLNAAVADANTYKDMGEAHANSRFAVLEETFGQGGKSNCCLLFIAAILQAGSTIGFYVFDPLREPATPPPAAAAASAVFKSSVSVQSTMRFAYFLSRFRPTCCYNVL
jgi:hypothetical protein